MVCDASLRTVARSLARILMVDQICRELLGRLSGRRSSDLADLAAVHAPVLGADLVLEDETAVFPARPFVRSDAKSKAGEFVIKLDLVGFPLIRREFEIAGAVFGIRPGAGCFHGATIC